MNSSLNHVYRIVWNAALGLWQVASEATRGRGKTGSSQQVRKARRALAAAGLTLAAPAAWAVLPTGGVVVAGQASIQQAGNALNIVQGTDKAAIDWQSFSIGQGNTVNFQQLSSSSVALNRVLGNDVSVIQGAINANGQVFLVNQNGVLFTPTAQVNVGGIVASTQNISTDDFMAGRYKFSGNSTATVENQGSIKAADGGVVALIAAKVINSGNIEALKGTVGLAAGNTVLLDLGGPVKIQVTEGALNAAIEQSGGIRADGGTVYLTAKAAGNLAASVINHTGVTKALSMAALTGDAGEVAQATGSIALSADLVNQAGTLDVSGLINNGRGGQIDVLAGQYTDSGTTLADGSQQGGSIDVRAKNITQTSSAVVSASSSEGEGGRVELIGDLGHGIGEFGGKIYATGRRRGGFVDTSGSKVILNDSLRVDTSSADGEFGTWLIDPIDFTIAASGGDLTGTQLGQILSVTNFTIQTDAQQPCVVATTCGPGKEGNGDIFVNDNVTWSSPAKLTLRAHRNILINKTLTASNANGSVALEYGQGAVALGNTAQYNFGLSSSGFAGKINLQAGNNFSTKLGSDGATTNYTVITQLGHEGSTTGTDLQGMNGNLAGNYALGANIDAASTAQWNGNAGFDGIGDQSGSGGSFVSNPFTGYFTGLGHTITQLTIKRPTSESQGLFDLTNNAVIRDVGVVNANIEGGVAVGTLVGSATGTAITQAYSTGSVKANITSGGGLVGAIGDGQISQAFSSVDVTGGDTLGGLGGAAIGVAAGGLTVSEVFATGAVSGSQRIGGLLGLADTKPNGRLTITNAYATGNATASQYSVGALIGSATVFTDSILTIDNVYAIGKVTVPTANKDSGAGLIGGVDNIDNPDDTGGTFQFTDSFFDTTTTTQTNAIGFISGDQATVPMGSTAAVGKTTAELKLLNTFANAGWSIAGAGGEYPVLSFGRSATVWTTGSLSTPVFIRLDCGLCESIYGETPQFSFKAFTAASGETAVTDAMLTGTALYSLTNGGVAAGTVLGRLTDKGTYAVTYTSGLTGSSMYELSAGAATNFTIKPKLLTVAITSATGGVFTQTYDGSPNANLTRENFVISGFVDQQGVGAFVELDTGSFDDANVLTATSVNAEVGADRLFLAPGVLKTNYRIPLDVTSQARITPKALSITTNEFVSSATANAVIATTDGLVAGQTVSALNLDGKNLSVAFGENTLASNYNTTVVVPGATGADLAVNRDLTLASGLNLTLRSDKDIQIGKVIDASAGTGSKVTLEFGQGAVAQDNTAEYVLRLTNDGFAGKINLKAGQKFSTKQGSDGTTTNFTVITALGEQGSRTRTDLQGIKGGERGNYVLGTDIDASVTGQWNNGAGFEPIEGSVGRPFSGTFDGLGHTVSNLHINASRGNVGLFGSTRNARLRHVGLDGGQVSGTTFVGALVGGAVGGLVSHVYSKNSVNGTTVVGGLVGSASGNAQFSHVFSTGAVTQDVAEGGFVGGLVGQLVGGSISKSYASGVVKSVGSEVGGLVGVISSNTMLSDVFATGAVEGVTNVGGLLGNASGAVINRAYSTGKVTGTEGLGGLIGFVSETGNTVTASFWGTETSGLSNAVGSGSIGTGVVGKTTAQLQNPFTFIDAGWNFETVWGKSITGGNGGNMQLRGFTNDNFDDYVRVADASKVYGAANSTITGAAVSGVGAANVTASLGSAVLELSDAGEYLYSSPNVLSVTNKVVGRTTFADFSTGKLTITPKALTVALQGTTANPLTKVYDGKESLTLGSGNFALSGFVGEQGVGAALNGVTSGSFNNANVLQANTVSANVGEGTLALGQGVKASNYSLPIAPVTAAGTITAKAVQVTGLTAQNKVYDGGVVAGITGTATVATDAFIQGDDVSVSGSVSDALFADKNAGNDIAVSVTGLSLTGEDASNYQVTTAGLKANITQRLLTITGSSVTDRDYDGTKAATVVVGTLNNLVEGERLGTTTASGTFADKDAGSNKNVTVAYTLADGPNMTTPGTPPGCTGGGATLVCTEGTPGTTIAGAKASNYTLANQTLKGNIAQKAVTVAGIVANGKTYDGNTTATLSNQGTVATGVSGESLAVTTSGSFNDRNAGARKVNTTTTIASTGDALASNYSLSNATNSVDATIAQKSLIIAATATNKVYDGKSTATATLSTGDLVTNDKVSLNQTAANFVNAQGVNDKNVGKAKTVKVTGLSLTGDDALNYKLNNEGSVATTTADISAKSLSISATASNKVYNANTLAEVTLSTGDKVEGDTLTLNKTASTFDTKDVGTGKTVTVAGLNLGGTDAGNYAISNLDKQVTAQADITQALLSVSGITAATKTYDGTKDASVSTKLATLNGLFDGDKLAVSATGSFADKTAETGKTVTLKSSYTGADVDNYKITDQATATADINQKALSIAATAIDKVYDGKTTAKTSLSTTDVVLNDTVMLNQTAANFINAQGQNDKNVGLDKTVRVTGLSLSGDDAANYKLTNVNLSADTTADISAKSLSISATASNKVYNANTLAEVTLSTGDMVAGDTLTLNKTAANFDTKNVCKGKTVTVSGLALSGIDALNYSLQNADAKTTADITQAALTISGITADNKTYDGNDSATVSTTNALYKGLVEGDKLVVSATGVFEDKHAGVEKTVNLTSTYAGDDVDNYEITSLKAVKADIAAKGLIITAKAENKVYDGNSTATVTLATIDIIGNDDVTLGQTSANFINEQFGNDKNVSIGKTVLVSGLGLTGDDALNYTVINEEGAALAKADITPKALTISGSQVTTKTYNGLKDATVVAGTLNGVVEGETLGLTTAVGTFDTKNVGTAKDVTVAYTLVNGSKRIKVSDTSTTKTALIKESFNAPALASNYTLAGETLKGDITAKSLTISGITADSKTYDGTNAAKVSTDKVIFDGLVEGDKLTISASGLFSDKNAAAGKTVNLTSTYAGDDVGNYSITDQRTTKADINKLSGVVVTADNQSKIVGAVDPDLTFSVSGLLEGDALSGGLTRDAGEAAGLYAITQGDLGNTNYEISTFTPAELTISQPIADVAIANANRIEQPALQPSLGERDDIEESDGDIQPFMITSNQSRASGPAQLVVVNGGIRLPNGSDEEQQ